MSVHFRLSQSDCLKLNDTENRYIEKSATGYMFLSQADGITTLTFTKDELAALLQTPNASLERGFYEPGTAATRMDSPVEYIQSLKSELRSAVFHRLAYVTKFLEKEEKGKVKRTPKSVAKILPIITAEIDAEAEKKAGGGVSKGHFGSSKNHRNPPSVSTYLTLVRRFEKGGHDPRALIPRTHLSGNRRVQFCAVGEDLIRKAIGLYASFQRPTAKYVVAQCIKDFKTTNRERRKDGLKPVEIPSKRTVARRIRKLDPYATYAQRFGAAAANRKFALYEHGIKASYPMERIEIDEWKVDILTLLDGIGVLDGIPKDLRKNLETTRLWLYLAIDCATRCVVSMHLCDKPNSQDAIRTLANATRDKSDLALAAGCKCTWHHGGGLGTVFTDYGTAFISEDFQTVVLDLRGLVGNPPLEIARLRGRVERIFRTFGTQLMPLLAGRTFSNPQDRGDYDSQKLSAHTQDSLMRILTLHVVDIYHNTPHQGLSGETPSNCWERLSKEKGVIPFPSAVQRCAVFGIANERKVTGRGVGVLGVDYACDALHSMHLRAPGSKARLRINPENLGWILVWSGDAWVVAKAIQRCFDGISLGQWRLASRALNLRHDQEATLHEETIERALQKIEQINADQMRQFNVTIPFMTAEDLTREERHLHLGLTIDPTEQPKLDLPQVDGAPAFKVPMPEPRQDLFNQSPISNKTDPTINENTPIKRRFGLEED